MSRGQREPNNAKSKDNLFYLIPRCVTKECRIDSTSSDDQRRSVIGVALDGPIRQCCAVQRMELEPNEMPKNKQAILSLDSKRQRCSLPQLKGFGYSSHPSSSTIHECKALIRSLKIASSQSFAGDEKMHPPTCLNE